MSLPSGHTKCNTRLIRSLPESTVDRSHTVKTTAQKHAPISQATMRSTICGSAIAPIHAVTHQSSNFVSLPSGHTKRNMRLLPGCQHNTRSLPESTVDRSHTMKTTAQKRMPPSAKRRCGPQSAARPQSTFLIRVSLILPHSESHI